MNVSVVIPHRDIPDLLVGAVASALDQHFDDVEVIVVDDGSSMSPASALSQFGDRVKLVERPPMGVSAARNAGIEVSTGGAILFLDADDQLHPDCLARRLAMLSPGVGAVVGNVRFLDLTLERNLGEGRRLMGKDISLRDIYRQNLGGACGALFLRESLDRCGWFDPQLRRAEDWDLLIRVATRYQVAYDDEPRVDVRVRPNSLTSSTRELYRDSIRVLVKARAYRSRGLDTWSDDRIARLNLTTSVVKSLSSNVERSQFISSTPETWPYMVVWALRYLKNQALRPFGKGRRDPCVSS